MFRVEIYGRVRRAVLVEGRSQRGVGREFGISREMVSKLLRYAVPPGYQRQQPVKRPKLGTWLGVIDAILEEDKKRPARQRHTSKRIFERLRAEHGYTGGYTYALRFAFSLEVILQFRGLTIPNSRPEGKHQAHHDGQGTTLPQGEIKAKMLHASSSSRLTPCQAVAAVRTRVRKRIAALEGVRLPEYAIVIDELRIVEDFLARAENYIEGLRGKYGEG